MNDRELTITALFSYSNAQELKEAADNDRHNPVMGTHLSTVEVNDGRHCLKKTLATLSACYSHREGGTGAYNSDFQLQEELLSNHQALKHCTITPTLAIMIYCGLCIYGTTDFVIVLFCSTYLVYH